MMLAASALLSACEISGPVVDTQAQVCAGWKPICATPDDVLTDDLASRIEGHDLYGVAQQCWKRTVCKGE